MSHKCGVFFHSFSSIWHHLKMKPHSHIGFEILVNIGVAPATEVGLKDWRNRWWKGRCDKPHFPFKVSVFTFVQKPPTFSHFVKNQQGLHPVLHFSDALCPLRLLGRQLLNGTEITETKRLTAQFGEFKKPSQTSGWKMLTDVERSQELGHNSNHKWPFWCVFHHWGPDLLLMAGHSGMDQDNLTLTVINILVFFCFAFEDRWPKNLVDWGKKRWHFESGDFDVLGAPRLSLFFALCHGHMSLDRREWILFFCKSVIRTFRTFGGLVLPKPAVLTTSAIRGATLSILGDTAVCWPGRESKLFFSQQKDRISDAFEHFPVVHVFWNNSVDIGCALRVTLLRSQRKSSTRMQLWPWGECYSCPSDGKSVAISHDIQSYRTTRAMRGAGRSTRDSEFRGEVLSKRPTVHICLALVIW